MKIRPATEQDFEAWAMMRKELWPDHSCEEHLKDLSSPKPTRLTAFVAEDPTTEKLHGFMELSVRPYVDGCATQNVPFLEGIWVDEEHRQLGIGRQFLKVAEDWARALGAVELASNILSDNELSYKAHIGWGFVETERVIYFCKTIGKEES